MNSTLERTHPNIDILTFLETAGKPKTVCFISMVVDPLTEEILIRTLKINITFNDLKILPCHYFGPN